MGTLFNQSARASVDVEEQDIIDEIVRISTIQANFDLSYDQILATRNMLELRRRNDLFVRDSDAFDEQMAGLGEILEDFVKVQRCHIEMIEGAMNRIADNVGQL